MEDGSSGVPSVDCTIFDEEWPDFVLESKDFLLLVLDLAVEDFECEDLVSLLSELISLDLMDHFLVKVA